MGFKLSYLWAAPEINPINKKAKSVPVLNPLNVYGRVFFFSWWGFMIAFMSWYAWAPLLTKTIKKDLKLSQAEVANSNILALTATLVVRAFSGPLCDRFGPRLVFAGCLIAGAIPTAFSFAIHNAAGIIILRFFIGILGATFVPCQVWCTGFYDKNIVGTANSLAGGWGNAGGGITYFVMPAIYDHFVSTGYSPHDAWRRSFFIPFALIMGTAIAMILLCPDTPTGKWSERHNDVKHNLEVEHQAGHHVDHSGYGEARRASRVSHSDRFEKKSDSSADIETGEVVEIDAEYTHEVIVNPTPAEMVKVAISPQTLALCAAYFNSFGSELAINAILGAYYLKNFKELNQTTSGRWAAMFGLLNVYGRPLGGIIGDVLYKYTKGSLWAKKIWIHFLGVMTGVFCIAIGLKNSHDLSTMIGLVAGLAFFMDAGNGANFALVPHVHPFANGIVSGLVGATGNFGGVVGAIIFRYSHTNYAKGIWVIGVISVAMNLAVCWIRPTPKNQIGGR